VKAKGKRGLMLILLDLYYKPHASFTNLMH
jgi:hypothetical protein